MIVGLGRAILIVVLDLDSADFATEIEREVAHYVATGEHDANAWRRYPGRTAIEQMTAQANALRDALLARIRDLKAGCDPIPVPRDRTSRAYLELKLAPMVTGIFEPEDQAVVLGTLVDSITFLTRDEVDRVLKESGWPRTNWDVARIWLDSIGGVPLAPVADGLLGLSENQRCYVSLRYFEDLEADLFADYVVHEAAHLLHNNKRRYVGLAERGRSEWLLDIEFRKRELFAYACEFWSRISTSAQAKKDRLALIDELAPRLSNFESEFDPEEMQDVLARAARARNGWRSIARACKATSPKRPPTLGE